jgi:hypothetical protein
VVTRVPRAFICHAAIDIDIDIDSDSHAQNFF